jgi:transcription elongation factor
VSLGDEFDDGDEVKVIRGKYLGEVGVVVARLKVHTEYVYVQLEDESDELAFLDAELEELICTSESSDFGIAEKQPLPRSFWHKTRITKSSP